MAARIFKNINYKVLVIGAMYGKLEKLDKIAELSKQYNLIIINGNICYPISDLSKLELIVSKFNELLKTNNNIHYNLGNYDLVCEARYPDSNLNYWLSGRPNVTFLEFKNQTTTIVTCGGVLPSFNKNDLLDNLETSFISTIDNCPWQEKYNGNYGYIISNNPIKNEFPEFYSFSMRMGNAPDGQIYAQEIAPTGLKNTFLI